MTFYHKTEVKGISSGLKCEFTSDFLMPHVKTTKLLNYFTCMYYCELCYVAEVVCFGPNQSLVWREFIFMSVISQRPTDLHR